MQNTARKFDSLIFDLDGTLLDTSEGILSAVRYTVDYFHLKKIPEERIRSFIGPPIQNSFAREYGVSVEIGKEYAAVFRERYKSYDLMKASLYPGMIDVMSHLLDLGCKLAVATYKREDYALRLLENFGLLKYCIVAHGSDMEGKLKKSDIIKRCISEMETPDSNRIALVGDTDSDKDGAQEAGIHFIGVTYGFGYTKGEKIEGAVGMIDRPEDLMEIVSEINLISLTGVKRKREHGLNLSSNYCVF